MGIRADIGGTEHYSDVSLSNVSKAALRVKNQFLFSPCKRWQSCPNASARAPALTDHRGHTLLNLSALRPEEYLLAPAESPRWVRAGRGAGLALQCSVLGV